MKKLSISKIEMKLLNDFLFEEIPWNNIQVSITGSQKEKMLDQLGDLLQKNGFDQDYELTKNGKITENIIDKLNGLSTSG